MFDNFSARHIGVSNEKELSEMLRTIGVKTVDELIGQVIPSSIRLKKPLALPEGMSEYEFAAHIRALADRNRPLRSFIGMGYYPTAVPAAITRNVFENPAWYTSYTPYQAEISQGRLEALLNFQTAVISLTGMEIGNCSLLDEGTAAAEAMAMMYSLRTREAVKEGRNQLFVDRNIFPQTLDLLLTRSEPFGIELIVDDYDQYEFTGREFGAIIQYPAADGSLRDYTDFAAAAHAKGALVTAVADLLALALLKAPGEWGADIAVGSAQRLGLPMGLGGPGAGYMTTREAYKRNMPGRIIGVSVDRLGNKALRMALQMREQHIKRERATSNICTASALMASMAGFYCVYNGPEGLRRAAETAHRAAVTAARALEALDYKLTSQEFFDTLETEAEAAVVQSLALECGINFYYPTEGTVRMSFDEVTTAAEIEEVVRIFAAAKGKRVKAVKPATDNALPPTLRRTTAYLQEPVFNSYRSESALMRYIKKLELRDISLANSMISLGSCTMKLNAAALMQPLSLAGFQNMHPFAPADQAEGYMQLIRELEQDLATITGLAACSLQPNSGAAGEYAGLMVIRAYHQSRGQGYRMHQRQCSLGSRPRPSRPRLPQHRTHTGLGPRHEPGVGGDGGNENRDGSVRRKRQHRRNGPGSQGERTRLGTMRPDGDLPLDPRRIREPHPRHRGNRTRCGRPSLHGRGEHERAGGSDEPGLHRRRRVPPEPAQDLCDAPRRRRTGRRPDLRGGTPADVPALASGDADGRRRHHGGGVGPLGFGDAAADHLRLHPDAGRRRTAPCDGNGHRERELHVVGTGARIPDLLHGRNGPCGPRNDP